MEWADIPRRPSRRTLRQFGALLTLLLAVTAWRLAPGGPWLAAGSAAAAAGVLTLAWPDGLRWLFVGWVVAVFPIGWLVGRGLLGLAFFALFLPVGLVMRALGRDPLGRRRSAKPSYFTSRPSRDTASYFRQY